MEHRERTLGGRWLGAAAALAVVAAAVSACTTSTTTGSRVKLYEDLDSLAADSTAIVAGTVTGQEEQTDSGGSMVVSSFEVSNAPENPQLGAKTEDSGEPVAVGDTVIVRQFPDESSRLRPGEEYLLFLTPSALPGDAGGQFYITGAVAGLYVRDGDDFTRVVKDSGDTLPYTIEQVTSGG